MNKKILIVHRTVGEAILKAVLNFLMAMGYIGVGIWLNSSAMQWLGFIFFLLTLFAMSNKSSCLSIAEARAELDKIEKKIEHVNAFLNMKD